MRNSPQTQFGSMSVSPWSTTPYSDAINRGKATDGTTGSRGNRIKRPMNGFMVWSQTERRRLSESNPGIHNAEISRRLGQMWLDMSEEDRLPFMEEAERLRILHGLQYPDYRYRPRKRTYTTTSMEPEEKMYQWKKVNEDRHCGRAKNPMKSFQMTTSSALGQTTKSLATRSISNKLPTEPQLWGFCDKSRTHRHAISTPPEENKSTSPVSINGNACCTGMQSYSVQGVATFDPSLGQYLTSSSGHRMCSCPEFQIFGSECGSPDYVDRLPRWPESQSLDQPVENHFKYCNSLEEDEISVYGSTGSWNIQTGSSELDLPNLPQDLDIGEIECLAEDIRYDTLHPDPFVTWLIDYYGIKQTDPQVPLPTGAILSGSDNCTAIRTTL